MWDTIKLIATSIIGGIITYLEPIYNPVTVLGFVFVLDIVFGILTDLIRNDDRIRPKKFLIAVAFLAMYLVIIASTYVIGERMGDAIEALYFVKILTYVFAYCYVSNILRNMGELAPGSKAIAFLDYFIGLQIIKRLPEVAEFFNLTKKDKHKNKD
jgi:intracellular septation protein A